LFVPGPARDLNLLLPEALKAFVCLACAGTLTVDERLYQAAFPTLTIETI
jgi:hypothetical protein